MAIFYLHGASHGEWIRGVHEPIGTARSAALRRRPREAPSGSFSPNFPPSSGHEPTERPSQTPTKPNHRGLQTMNRPHNCPLVMLSMLLGSTAAAQSWTNVQPARAPSPPRTSFAVASNINTGKVILFGGRNAAGQVLQDTWEFDSQNATWQQLTVTTSPPARSGAAMTHDVILGTVLFGGRTARTILDDTWVFSGTTWRQVQVANQPPRRNAAAMAADTFGSTIMFGGEDLNGILLGDTWRFNGQSWTLLPSGPAPRSNHSMVFQANKGVLFMFGGRTFAAGGTSNDTWMFTNNQWQQLAVTTAPSARSDAAFAFDPLRDRCVLFGGLADSSISDFAVLGETWEFSSDWLRRPSALDPAPRMGAGMASLHIGGGVVLFGGVDANGLPLGDTQEFHGPPPTIQTSGPGCPGQANAPTMAASLPSLGSVPTASGLSTSQLISINSPGAASFNAVMEIGISNTVGALGQALPFSLQNLGMPGCSQLSSEENLTFLVGTGGSAAKTVDIPNSLALDGIVFFAQAIVMDPSINNPAQALVSESLRFEVH